MKHHRLLTLALTGALALGLTACGPKEPTVEATPTPTAEATPTPGQPAVDREDLKVGFLYPGDPSDVGYTRSQSETIALMPAAQASAIARYGTLLEPAYADQGESHLTAGWLR